VPPRKSTTIATPGVAAAAVALACALLLVGCRRAPEVTRVERRFDELLHAPFAPAASTAGSAWLTIDGESRPVIARPETVVHAEGLRVEAAGAHSFRAHALDGISEPLPVVEAKVRPAGGEWQPRVVSLGGSEAARVLNVIFTAADATQPVDLLVSAWLPPLPLDVTTGAFTVPARARVRFATAVRSEVPLQAQFRVSVQPAAGKPDAVWVSSATDAASAGSVAGWHDVDVDLHAYAGQAVRLRFEGSITSTVSLSDAPIAPPRAVISAPQVLVPAPARQAVDNLIVVSIDTLRADHVGAYGYRRAVSPTIDRLASAGTLFEHVFAVWPETSASHMTLFTSLYPSVHGIGISKWGSTTLPAWQLTFAEWLGHQGFVTAAITEDGLLAAAAGFPRGFDVYRELRGGASPDAALGVNPVDGLPIARRRLGAVHEGVAHATNWLRQHREDRFFLFLHTYQVHQRLAPGATYDALRTRFVHDGVSPEITDANSYLATYDAAIAYTDETLRSLVETLDELQLTRRTLLVVTSDHGEAFYEHGEFGHGHSLYDEELRIPLVLYCPGRIAAGKRVTTQIGLIDLAPTLLEWLQLPALPQAEGRSAAALLGGDDTATGRAPLIGEIGDDQRAVRAPVWKLMRADGTAGAQLRFYDLQADPGERTSLPAADNPNAQSALQLLAQHQADTEAWRAQLQQSAGAAAPVAAHPLDAETRERMRALGYEAPEN